MSLITKEEGVELEKSNKFSTKVLQITTLDKDRKLTVFIKHFIYVDVLESSTSFS